jgi:hypothetical protein
MWHTHAHTHTSNIHINNNTKININTCQNMIINILMFYTIAMVMETMWLAWATLTHMPGLYCILVPKVCDNG